MDSEKLQAGPRDGEVLTDCDIIDVGAMGMPCLRTWERQLLSMLKLVRAEMRRRVAAYEREQRR